MKPTTRWTLLALLFTSAPAAAAPPLDFVGDPLPPGAVARLGPARFAPDGQVCGMAFAPDGKGLVAATWDQRHQSALVVWDANTGKELRRLPWEKQITCLAFSPDGRFLVVADDSDRVHFLDPTTGQRREQPRLVVKDSRIRWFSFSADGKRLALAGGDTIHFWNLETGQRLWTVQPHFKPINGIACAPDGRSVATTSIQRDRMVVTLWETSTTHVRVEWRFPSPSLRPWSGDIAFSPEGSSRLAASTGSVLYLWDATDSREVLKAAHQGPFLFTPDGSSLLGVGEEGLRVWDTDSGKKTGGWERPSGPLGDGAIVLAVSPDSHRLAAQHGRGPILFWDLATGTRWRPSEAHDASIWIVAWSPDGRIVATGAEDGTVRLWEAATGRPLPCLTGLQSSIRELAFAPDGRTLAAAGVSDDEVRVWHVADGRQWYRIGGHDGGVAGVAFTADSKSLLTCSTKGKVRALELATGQVSIRLRDALGQVVHRLLMSPDGRTVACIDEREGEITVWSAATETPLYRLKPEKSYHDVSFSLSAATFSADGKWLIAVETYEARFPADSAQTIRIWELATGKEIHRIESGQWINTDSVTALNLSVDGRFLAAETRFGGLFLWDLLTNRKLTGHGIAAGRSPAFSPDGRFFAIRHVDNTVLIWDTQPWRERPLPFAVRESDAVRGQHWQALGSDDGPRAFAALQTLRATPDAAVDFLGKQLRPTATIDPLRVSRWIADLDSNLFAVRRDATAELEEVAELAAPALRKALSTAPGLETSRRLDRLLRRAEQIEALPTGLRAARAVAVLEGINSPEARTVLARWAEGAPDAVLTRQAREALQRLERCSAAK